jgi:hypothetical protein
MMRRPRRPGHTHPATHRCDVKHRGRGVVRQHPGEGPPTEPAWLLPTTLEQQHRWWSSPGFHRHAPWREALSTRAHRVRRRSTRLRPATSLFSQLRPRWSSRSTSCELGRSTHPFQRPSARQALHRDRDSAYGVTDVGGVPRTSKAPINAVTSPKRSSCSSELSARYAISRLLFKLGVILEPRRCHGNGHNLHGTMPATPCTCRAPRRHDTDAVEGAAPTSTWCWSLRSLTTPGLRAGGCNC